MLQLAQLPHRPGNSHLGEGSSPIPSSLGWGVQHIPVLLEQTHQSQKGLADLGVTSCGGRKMEDRASILLLCKHLCLPPKEQPECIARNTGPLASLGRERALCWGKDIAGLNHMCSSWWHCQAGTVSLMDY